MSKHHRIRGWQTVCIAFFFSVPLTVALAMSQTAIAGMLALGMIACVVGMSKSETLQKFFDGADVIRGKKVAVPIEQPSEPKSIVESNE